MHPTPTGYTAVEAVRCAQTFAGDGIAQQHINQNRGPTIRFSSFQDSAR